MNTAKNERDEFLRDLLQTMQRHGVDSLQYTTDDDGIHAYRNDGSSLPLGFVDVGDLRNPQPASSACPTCEPVGVFATDGTGPYDCYTCGKPASGAGGQTAARELYSIHELLGVRNAEIARLHMAAPVAGEAAQRYTFVDGVAGGLMVEDPEGEWVRYAAPPAPAAVPVDSRAQFEEWAAAQNFRASNIDTSRDSVVPEWYVSDVAALAWCAWQAASTKCASPQPAAPQGVDLAAEVARLNAIINSPQSDDFIRAVSTEAEHQRQRWGSDSDAGKTPADWFWLVGYLAGKALHAHAAGDAEKAEHHVITTAAACANWHRAMFGRTDMRPGIDSQHQQKESGA